MGKYKAQGKIYNLLFEDRPGLEVRTASISLGKLLEVADQADRVEAGAGLSEVMDLVALFVSKLRSWNVTDEKEQDIEPTREGFLSLDSDDALAMLLAWYQAMSGRIDQALGKGSTSGAPFPEESIPMAVG